MRNAIRGLAVPAAMFALIWATRAEACEQLGAYQQLIAPPPTHGSPTLTVPVVIHIIERHGQPCSVRDAWPSATLVTLFGPNRNNVRTVSSVWGGTRIRFVVHDVMLHEIDPPPGLSNNAQDVLTPMTGPLGTPQWEAAFQALMTQFHRTSSVNVYLWTTLASDQAGFGRSPRTGNGKATVFLAAKCVDSTQMTPKHCARVVAHEFGHALGLYHSGPNTCANVQPQFRQICTTTSVPCGESRNSARLMASGAQGRKLCPIEVSEAERMTTQLR